MNDVRHPSAHPSNSCSYVKNLSFLGAWDALQHGCRGHMERLGAYLDTGVFRHRRLAETFESYVPQSVRGLRTGNVPACAGVSAVVAIPGAHMTPA